MFSSPVSTASGIRWMNAPPISAPADRATNSIISLLKTFLFIDIENTPTSDIRLTITVLMIICPKTILDV